ncbi:MAG: ATP-binding protein [Gemmatimonadaceae bacterium]
MTRTSRWPTSLRSRLTLWYTVLLGLPLIALALGAQLLFARTLQSRTDAFIGDALTAFSRELVAERRATLSAALAIQSTISEVRFRDLHIVILDSSGKVVDMTPPQERPSPEDRRPSEEVVARILTTLRAHDLSHPVALTVPSQDGSFRVLSRPLLVANQSFRLTGAYSLRDVDDMLAQVRGVFLVVIPLLLILGATGGYFLATRSLAPVGSMANRAAEISATNLGQRLPVGGGDELVGLATVVNDLLARLEASFAQQRRFVADASHELRTPTAILRTEADVTLSRKHRTEEEYRASMTIMRDGARRLTRIVEDLFLLARSDSDQAVLRREPLYLDEIVHDVTRSVRPLAEARGIKVEVEEFVEAPFSGDGGLIDQLLLNLLDNAIKHSPHGGVVVVRMAREGDEYHVSVCDSGPGIPESARERIFERFFRVDAARSRNETSATSGAGLGLAIARRIAEMHGGRLELANSGHGVTEFRLTLPAGDQPTDARETLTV